MQQLIDLCKHVLYPTTLETGSDKLWIGAASSSLAFNRFCVIRSARRSNLYTRRRSINLARRRGAPHMSQDACWTLQANNRGRRTIYNITIYAKQAVTIGFCYDERRTVVIITNIYIYTYQYACTEMTSANTIVGRLTMAIICDFDTYSSKLSTSCSACLISHVAMMIAAKNGATTTATTVMTTS